MSTGSLTQLAALGSQDQYLSVAGEITFFKGVYRRHTNFAKESVFMAFNQTPNWGQQTTCVISRTGDLLSKVWLNVKIPALNEPLKKKEFFNLKKALLGDNVKLLDSAGVPVVRTSAATAWDQSAPTSNYDSNYAGWDGSAAENKAFSIIGSAYNPDWTYEMNVSHYLPVPKDIAVAFDTLTNPLVVGTKATSVPKNFLSLLKGQDTTVALTSFDTADQIKSAGMLNSSPDPAWPITSGSRAGVRASAASFVTTAQTDASDLTEAQYSTLRTNLWQPKKYYDYTSPFIWHTGPLDENTFDQSMELQKEFIQSNPGKYPKARYCDEVGHAMIDKVELVIGGTLIDSHPGHYLHVWNELTQTPEKKQIAHLIGRSGSESELEDMAMEDQSLFIPLQFFFCRHLMCSLPLIALQYHQV